MSQNFLKFKRRLMAIRMTRALLIGLSAGLLASGVWLGVIKLAELNIDLLTAIFVGVGALLLSGGIAFLLGGKSDKQFAEELDEQFNLKARVQTMVAFKDEEGELIALQREDADASLSTLSVKDYKLNRLWIYLTALLLSAAVLTGGILIKDMRGYIPPEEIEPFELSALQEAGLTELIKYVNGSDMEEEFRTEISAELEALLAELRRVETKPDMQAALARAMAVICDITYRSSTSTEMLNALWDSGDVHLRYFAKALDTSSWQKPDWGDFAEGLTEYASILMGDNAKEDDEDALVGVASLKWALDSMSRKLEVTLEGSGISPEDEIYSAIIRLFDANPGGLRVLLAGIDRMNDDEARRALDQSLSINSQQLFDALSLNRVNAFVGEYTMTRLASLFLVPMPEFERPEFVKTGESVDGGGGSAEGDKDDENTQDGGVGEGAVYGSNDLVLDPLTGQLVEYGELLDNYFGIMNERLEGDSYTEEQKKAIIKYFELLYGGLEKEEGN